MLRSSLVLFVCAALIAGCGGGSATPSGNTGSPRNGSGNAVSAPVAVSVFPGVTTSGINVAVAKPASATPPNAQVLGVGSTAQSTGDIVHLGETESVFLCGPGLSGNMQVFVGGSTFGSTVNDVTVVPGSVADTTCRHSDGSTGPGMQFLVHITPGASLGARTVYLLTANDDVTTFTGGLEVVP